jgi:hypothetical protein
MRVSLQDIHCYATTESDGDEIYCLVAPGVTTNQNFTRLDIGDFAEGVALRPNKLLWSGSSGATIRFMEDDEQEPGHGSDDFIGEIVVNADGSCTPRHNTLDEGFDEGRRYRRFSLQGSGANYLVQLEIVA